VIDEVKTLTVADAVAEKLISKIMANELSWGQKLPSQRDLAKMLNVGISSLREGLQILQAMGFIELKPGRGTYITADSSIPFSKNIALSIYSDTSVQNLMEAREVLDTGLAVLAAKKADPKDIKKMETQIQCMEKSISNGNSSILQCDIEFHICLADSVKNPLLEKFSYVLRSSLEKFIGTISHTERGVELHRKVLDAIKNREPLEARDSMIELLKHTRQVYLEYLYKKEGSHGSSIN